MVLMEDIQSLSDFQRNARQRIKRLKETGRPAVLTVNGQAEIVVQDAKSYEALVAKAHELEEHKALLRSIRDYRAGRVRDARAVLAGLEAKHVGKPGRRVRR